jgi:hypothetical protein
MKRNVLCLFTGLFLLSCTTRPVTPSKASRRAIDTIYQAQVLLKQSEMDSLCTRLKDSIYPLAVDSILNERRAEMFELVQ